MRAIKHNHHIINNHIYLWLNKLLNKIKQKFRLNRIGASKLNRKFTS